MRHVLANGSFVELIRWVLMESLFLLIPMSLLLVGFIVMVLYWAIKNGQFDDLEGPAYEILMDDDTHHNSQEATKK